MPNSNITEVYSKIKFQSIDEKKVFATGFMIRGFFFVFSGAIFGIRWFESFCRLKGSISKKLFLGFRGFESLRRMDGSVLEGTICKQFVSNAKSRKNLKPCRGFKSFRSLAFLIQFLKNRIFGSSNPSTRRKIENGSMEIQKKLGAKKAEKSLEISAFLVFSRSDLNRPKDLAHPFKIDPQSKFFRNRSVFFGRWIDLSLGDDGNCTRPLSSGLSTPCL